MPEQTRVIKYTLEYNYWDTARSGRVRLSAKDQLSAQEEVKREWKRVRAETKYPLENPRLIAEIEILDVSWE